VALAVALQIGRTRSDQPLALPDREVLRQPSALRIDGARFLEGRQPVPFQERRPVSDQRVPGVARDLAQRIEPAECGHAGRPPPSPGVDGARSPVACVELGPRCIALARYAETARAASA